MNYLRDGDTQKLELYDVHGRFPERADDNTTFRMGRPAWEKREEIELVSKGLAGCDVRALDLWAEHQEIFQIVLRGP